MFWNQMCLAPQRRNQFMLELHVEILGIWRPIVTFHGVLPGKTSSQYDVQEKMSLA